MAHGLLITGRGVATAVVSLHFSRMAQLWLILWGEEASRLRDLRFKGSRSS